ncbi:NAD-dependent deacylase [Aliiroseovarius sp. 2305UL8-7]|uniref:NAD-dependent deacylase n=1 Tax=Aliiroseovarius conchicola TaxID=3121637 RepID=UPI003528CE0C
MSHIVILTGAGISAESGLGTFRDKDGLWTKYDLDEVATPDGFARNPSLVHEFYNARRANCLTAYPNSAHKALGQLQACYAGRVSIVTQNVDDLHERGGATDVIHMHGELSGALCDACGHRWPAPPVMSPDTLCPACHAARSRPDIVWFGEMPYRMDDIYSALEGADLFVAIGTSGNVYPAAGLVLDARTMGIATLELNLEPSETASAFDEARFGPATRVVPDWVQDVLAQGA